MDTTSPAVNTTTVMPPPPPAPQYQTPTSYPTQPLQYPPQSAPALSYEYAGFGSRLLAVIIDGLIIGAVSFVIQITVGIFSGILGASSQALDSSGVQTGASIISMIISMVGGLVQFAISMGYSVYFIGKNGQTIGKKILNIKVVNPDTLLPVGYGSAALREIIGKMLSSFVFSLGYLWMLWDDKKQTWHDKIAHTIVIKS
jgi:uncharacterized RDD family membrane protein YckC